jgi:hypothetical protein
LSLLCTQVSTAQAGCSVFFLRPNGYQKPLKIGAIIWGSFCLVFWPQNSVKLKLEQTVHHWMRIGYVFGIFYFLIFLPEHTGYQYQYQYQFFLVINKIG